jgi:Na+/H+-translocating membrane pyrophosphatase
LVRVGDYGDPLSVVSPCVRAGLSRRGLLLGAGIAIAFFLGVFASYGAGYVGMYMAVRGNLRTAAAALTSFKGALEIAFRAGAVSGMFTVGLGLLGATVIFLLFREKAMFVLVGFGFGGSLAALFMRVGGGIYTKGADVGADLVGKVEAASPKTTRATPPRLPIMSATMWATARGWRRMCSSPTRSRWSPRLFWVWRRASC